MDAFAFILKHEPAWRKICAQSCYHRPHLAEDLWSEVVVDQMSQIIRTYHPWFGSSLFTHVYGSLRWYCFKWMQAHDAREARHESLEGYDAAARDSHPLDARDSVQYLCRNLSDYERQLLRLRHDEGMTFEDVADTLGICKCTARKHYWRAIERIRDENGFDRGTV